MKFRVAREVLADAVAWTARSLPPRPSVPVLAGILLEIDGNQLSVSGFSEVFQTFGGGIGQIAIHGWNNDNVIGNDVSNGCVRMRNVDIATVADLAPLGTPVQIVE